MKGSHNVETLTLTSSDMDADNSLENPNRITPHKGSTKATGEKVTVLEDNVPAMTFRIYRIQK